VAFFELGNRQSAAVTAEIVKPSHGRITMPLADRTGRRSAVAVLDVFRANPSDQRVLVNGCLGFLTHACDSELRQGPFGKPLVLGSANPLALFVEQRRAPFRAGQRVVPAVGLLPVSGRPGRLSTFFSRSSHAQIVTFKISMNLSLANERQRKSEHGHVETNEMGQGRHKPHVLKSPTSLAWLGPRLPPAADRLAAEKAGDRSRLRHYQCAASASVGRFWWRGARADREAPALDPQDSVG
jgi:hypothetical protein